ncbi:MAG TPA: PEP-CTERM sorting domain-containing protein [Phycisphaerae bacterium]|nr:PEP-CTERM sorting domain-containing protein [Phycisphaerae bacterium]HSA29717.1 PEP-CTERM sorting domain-containing protein [Phycisphaerae bacterium]
MSTTCGRVCVGMIGLAVLTGLAVTQARAAVQDLLVTSSLSDAVLRYDGTTGANLGPFASVRAPMGITYGPDGNLYVGSYRSYYGEGNDNVQRFDGRTGAPMGTFTSGGALIEPLNLAFGPDGNLYAASFSNNQILRYNGMTGAYMDAFIPAGSGGLIAPTGFVFAPGNKLYVGGGGNPGHILVYDATTGAPLGSVASVIRPGGMALGPDGNLYAAGYNSANVVRFDGRTGAFIDVFVPAGGPGRLSSPTGVLFGPDGNLYVASSGTDLIQRYNGTTGDFIDTFASGGGLNQPWRMVFTPEPATLALLGAGVLGAAVRRRRH